MLSAFISSVHSYPAMPLAGQLVHQRYVHPGPLVLRTAPFKSLTPAKNQHPVLPPAAQPSSRDQQKPAAPPRAKKPHEGTRRGQNAGAPGRWGGGGRVSQPGLIRGGWRGGPQSIKPKHQPPNLFFRFEPVGRAGRLGALRGARAPEWGPAKRGGGRGKGGKGKAARGGDGEGGEGL